jgi:antitoxin component of MazEF toxin-antitoxin module
MKTSELSVTRVGNSRGVRLPAEVLRRYKIGDTLLMELSRPERARYQKLPWAETYQQMAQTDEDWTDWESLPGGLPSLSAVQRVQRARAILRLSSSRLNRPAGPSTRARAVANASPQRPTRAHRQRRHSRG